MHNTIIPLAELQELIDHPVVSVNECYFVMADSGVMSWRAVKQEMPLIVSIYSELDMEDIAREDGQWLPVVMQVNYENKELWCDHTNERIPSLYAEED